MTQQKHCRTCETVLTDENWFSSSQRYGNYICNTCMKAQSRKWNSANPDKCRTYRRRSYCIHRTATCDPKDSPCYLGITIAEQVLSQVFKNVKRMPGNNHGFDFICAKGKKIDVKASCIHTRKGWSHWAFEIRHNTIADYFLCLAFDNRTDLNPLHLWLIPGSIVNHLEGTSIASSTIHKWDEYKLPINKVVSCCEAMR